MTFRDIIRKMFSRYEFFLNITVDICGVEILLSPILNIKNKLHISLGERINSRSSKVNLLGDCIDINIQ